MKKILLLICFAFFSVSLFAQPFTTISNGESGLSVRNNLNNLITWTNNLGLDLEFSDDNSTWHYPWVSGDVYIRYSGDFGVTWSDGMYIAYSDSFFVQLADSLTQYVTPKQLTDTISKYAFVEPRDSILFNKTSNLSYLEGKQYYDSVTQSLVFMSGFSDIGLQQGEELWTPLMRNTTGATIVDGTPVVIDGDSGGLATIDSASNLTYSESRLIGIATHDIANGDSGRVTIFGDVSRDWSSLNVGLVYLGENGTLTNTRPTGGRWIIIVGYLHDNSSNGKMFVNPTITERTAEINDTKGWPMTEKPTLTFTDATRRVDLIP